MGVSILASVEVVYIRFGWCDVLFEIRFAVYPCRVEGKHALECSALCEEPVV